MSESKPLTGLIFRGLLLVLCAPVLAFVVFVILKLITAGAGLSAKGINIIISAKAIFYCTGIVLYTIGSFKNKKSISIFIGVAALLAVLLQLLPHHLSSSVTDIVLTLPGLALMLLFLAVWLPRISEDHIGLILMFFLSAFLIAYHLFQIIAGYCMSYALPSIYEAYPWLDKLGLWGTWAVYLLLLAGLFSNVYQQHEIPELGSSFWRKMIAIIFLGFLGSVAISGVMFIQLEESSMTVEYVLDSSHDNAAIDVTLPLPCSAEGEPLLEENDFEAFYEGGGEVGGLQLRFIETDYGMMLRLTLNQAEEKLTIRGNIKSQKLVWDLGKEPVPAVLNPRIINEEWQLSQQFPVYPEHNASLFTAVNFSGDNNVRLNYGFEIVVKGIKKGTYQQVFSSYLPFNYFEGIELEKGWQLVPMVEEIFVREAE